MRKKSCVFFVSRLPKKQPYFYLRHGYSCLQCLHSAFQQQDRTVKGKVTDENNAPLANVSVSVQGGNKSVMTDAEGNFEIPVSSAKATLLFSSIGYSSKDVSVGNNTTINVPLIHTSKQLSDVVVTGYGRSSKKDHYRRRNQHQQRKFQPGSNRFANRNCYRVKCPV